MTYRMSLYTAAIAATLLAPAAMAQSAGNSAAIEQQGNYNSTEITQSGANNTAEVALHGNGNGTDNGYNSDGIETGKITQSGNGAFAKIFIEGDRNSFDIDQSGPGYGGRNSRVNALVAGVRGSDNRITVDQVSELSAAYRNSGKIAQQGDYNSATIDQKAIAYGEYGGVNTAWVDQEGAGNTATIDQNGTDNFAELNQVGQGNTGTISQDGAGLYAKLSQTGTNLSYILEQSGTFNQTGCGTPGACPTISITQTQDPTIYTTPAGAPGS